jgi:hypothetical protein
LKRRHRGYLIVLAMQVLLLLLLPLAQHAPWLLSLLMISLSSVLIAFVSRFSPLRRTKPLVYSLGAIAVLMEVVWHVGLRFDPALGQWLTIPHVIVWLIFLVLVLLRKVRTLINEPYVTTSVVLGAASGYLLVGIAGGVMLIAISALSPLSLTVANLSKATVISAASAGVVADAPSLMAASFNMLTTVGTPVVNPTDVLGQVAVTIITVSGQLYVAILIALILGRYHKRKP